MPLTPKQLAEFEVLAQGLKKDGYTAGVVSRKMISQHGMPESEAVALVSRLYGTSADPRTGDTTAAVLMGAVMLAAGLFAVFFMFFVVGVGLDRFSLVLALMFLSVSGAGLRKLIIALVNAGVKEDLGGKR